MTEGTGENDRRTPAGMTEGAGGCGQSDSYVILEVAPVSFPTSPPCHSQRHLQYHSRRHPSVIPDVCNRESSQLKKRKPWIPANYQRE